VGTARSTSSRPITANDAGNLARRDVVTAGVVVAE
jgi:hypothetical protein